MFEHENLNSTARELLNTNHNLISLAVTDHQCKIESAKIREIH